MKIEYTFTDCCVTHRLCVEYDVLPGMRPDRAIAGYAPDVIIRELRVLAAWLDIDGQRHQVRESQGKGWTHREEFFKGELQLDDAFREAAIGVASDQGQVIMRG